MKIHIASIAALVIALTNVTSAIAAKGMSSTDHRGAARHFNDLANNHMEEARKYKRLARRHVELAQQAESREKQKQQAPEEKASPAAPQA